MCCALGRLLVALVLLTASSAWAGEPPELAHPDQPENTGSDQPSAADVADAPRPEDASGVAIPADDDRPSPALAVPRALLMPVRLAGELAVLPVRSLLYSVDRYGLVARLQALLQGPSRFAVQPIVKADSDFGLHFGARLTIRGFFDSDESLRFQAGAGGLYNSYFAMRLDSGTSLGRHALRYELEVEDQGRARFEGIGNQDATPAAELAAPIDPLMASTAAITRFSQRILRNQIDLESRWSPNLYSHLSATHLWREFSDTADDDALNTADVFDPDALIGYRRGLSTVYSEAVVGFDNRKAASDPLSVTVPNRGWRVEAFGGYARGIGVDPSNYGRFGLDVQHFLEPFRKDRILALRFYAEGVTANIDEVPFVDLPALGGSRFLRGYRSRRFRGQMMALAEAEYHWAVGANISSFLLLDVGRVYRDEDDLGLRELRASVGGGLLFHTGVSYLARLFVAGSEESVRLYLSFSPIFKVKDRAQRY